MRYLLSIDADLHSNSIVGLHPCQIPAVDDLRPNDATAWLWSKYVDSGLWLDRLADQYRVDKRLQVWNGDTTDQGEGRTHRVVSEDDNDAIEIAVATVRPKLERCDETYFAAGTGCHGGVDNAVEEAIARCVRDRFPGRVVPPPEGGNVLWEIVKLDLDGYLVDCAHTGRMAALRWNSTGWQASLSYEVLALYLRYGWRPPHLAIFSHVHLAGDSGTNNELPIRVMETPSWQMQPRYATRRPFRGHTLGCTGVVIEDGRVLYAEHKIYRPAEDRRWKPGSLPKAN